MEKTKIEYDFENMKYGRWAGERIDNFTEEVKKFPLDHYDYLECSVDAASFLSISKDFKWIDDFNYIKNKSIIGHLIDKLPIIINDDLKEFEMNLVRLDKFDI